MAARQYVISVGTSATALEGTQFPTFRLLNNGANPIFIGDSAVTTSTGYPVEADAVFTLSELANKSLTGRAADRLYGIVAASTEEARVIVEGRINA